MSPPEFGVWVGWSRAYGVLHKYRFSSADRDEIGLSRAHDHSGTLRALDLSHWLESNLLGSEFFRAYSLKGKTAGEDDTQKYSQPPAVLTHQHFLFLQFRTGPRRGRRV
jgi:hypothetical protein